MALPNGRTATRAATVSRDGEADTRSRSVVATGPNGGIRTVNDQLERTDSGFARNTELTRANGATVTRGVDATYDSDAKTVTKNVTVERERPAR